MEHRHSILKYTNFKNTLIALLCIYINFGYELLESTHVYCQKQWLICVNRDT